MSCLREGRILRSGSASMTVSVSQCIDRAAPPPIVLKIGGVLRTSAAAPVRRAPGPLMRARRSPPHSFASLGPETPMTNCLPFRVDCRCPARIAEKCGIPCRKSRRMPMQPPRIGTRAREFRAVGHARFVGADSGLRRAKERTRRHNCRKSG